MDFFNYYCGLTQPNVLLYLYSSPVGYSYNLFEEDSHLVMVKSHLIV